MFDRISYAKRLLVLFFVLALLVGLLCRMPQHSSSSIDKASLNSKNRSMRSALRRHIITLPKFH